MAGGLGLTTPVWQAHHSDMNLDRLALRLFGRTQGNALERGVCLRCGKRTNPDEMDSRDALEYGISGFCPECFNEVTPDDEKGAA